MSSSQVLRASSEDSLKAALGACRTHLAYAGGFSAFINLLYIAPTIYMLQVYDRVVPSHGVTSLIFLTLLLLVSLATLSLVDVSRSRLLVRASARLEATLARPILQSSLRRGSGGGGARSMREFDKLRQTVTGAGVLALFDAPWTVVYIALCFLIHPALGMMALIGSGALIALTLMNERATRPRLEKANEAASWSYVSQGQSAAASELIRAMGMREAMVSRHQQERVVLTNLQSEASFAAGRYIGLTKFIRLSLQSLALGVAAYLALNQQISAGAIFAASLLIARALSPIEQVLGSWRSIEETLGAYAYLKAQLGEWGPDQPRTRLPPPSGRLDVEGVTVCAASRDLPVLQDASFSVAAGEVVGLVGPSGAGKTTLVRALVGAADLSEGRVRLDGADINDWDCDRLGRHIGYLPQDVGLFQGTVKQNICRFRDGLGEDADEIDAKVIAAAQSCGAHEMILGLPSGYDTRLDWGGRGVSLGQAQKIALARALFDRPSLVALDEPNAHLDADGEAALLKALFDLKARGASVIVVAHKTSLLEVMDKLVVVIGGRVVEQGPRNDVLLKLNQPPPQPTERQRVVA
jgi:ATP-binding cassette subfamily C protein